MLFPGVCFVLVFDQTLVEHLYHDKGLLGVLVIKVLFIYRDKLAHYIGLFSVVIPCTVVIISIQVYFI